MLNSELKNLFEPKSVAVIGASTTEGKLGYAVFKNLATLGYSGKLFPINPKGGELLGYPIYTKLSAIKKKIDLAIILVPAPFVESVLNECGKQKIKNIVIISAGFKEIGGEGIKRENAIKKLIEKYKFNLIGPNCLGIINTNFGLNASFAEGMPMQGNVGLISQSGAMAVAISDWAYTHNLGFSKIISLGNKAGVNEIELLEYLEKDRQTEVILMYLESIEDGQKFMKTAKRITRKKPIIIIKSGTSKSGTKAISSHTGSLAGSQEAVKAAFRQSGVIRAETVEDLFNFARGFSYQKIPQGNRVAIISNAGGPAIMATDSIESSCLEMSKLEEKTQKKLKQNLPETAAVHNPVDIIGDALADRYEKALNAVVPDKNVDAIIVLLTPQIMTEEEKTAKILAKFSQKFPKKTMLACFMGGKNVADAKKILSSNKVPNYGFPDRAVATLEQMEKYARWKKQKLATIKSCKSRVTTADMESFRRKLKKYAGQVPMSLSIELLKKYKIHMPVSEVAKNSDEAVIIAEKIGFPVVLKICSKEIIHKTDAGGVRVDLKNADEVKKAYEKMLKDVKKYNASAKIDGVFVQEMTTLGREVIIGMKRDPQFGPLLMFGLGGIYVEVLKDVTFRIAPVSLQEAEKMIYEINAIQLLKGVRGEKSIDFKKLAEVICRISQLALDFPEIQEIDLNPLVVNEKGSKNEVVAIDVRMLV